jgi:hypothetical protein
MSMRTTRAKALAAAGLLAGSLLLVPACSDEDGDGGTTDEEIQDVRDGVNDAGDRVDLEVDAQDQGSNQDDG